MLTDSLKTLPINYNCASGYSSAQSFVIILIVFSLANIEEYAWGIGGVVPLSQTDFVFNVLECTGLRSTFAVVKIIFIE